jgi:hypothetical protein
MKAQRALCGVCHFSEDPPLGQKNPSADVGHLCLKIVPLGLGVLSVGSRRKLVQI